MTEELAGTNQQYSYYQNDHQHDAKSDKRGYHKRALLPSSFGALFNQPGDSSALLGINPFALLLHEHAVLTLLIDKNLVAQRFASIFTFAKPCRDCAKGVKRVTAVDAVVYAGGI